MKKAFLVVGAESSGTRFLTHILVYSGISGDASHWQPYDTIDPTEDLIVWRRSVPHGLENPDFVAMTKKLQALDYQVYFLVIHREISATVLSQIKNFDTIDSEEVALERIQKAYLFIYDSIQKTNCPYLVVTYESLCNYPLATLRGISKYFNLNLKNQTMLEMRI